MEPCAIEVAIIIIIFTCPIRESRQATTTLNGLWRTEPSQDSRDVNIFCTLYGRRHQHQHLTGGRLESEKHAVKHNVGTKMDWHQSPGGKYQHGCVKAGSQHLYTWKFMKIWQLIYANKLPSILKLYIRAKTHTNNSRVWKLIYANKLPSILMQYIFGQTDIPRTEGFES